MLTLEVILLDYDDSHQSVFAIVLVCEQEC